MRWPKPNSNMVASSLGFALVLTLFLIMAAAVHQDTAERRLHNSQEDAVS